MREVRFRDDDDDEEVIEGTGEEGEVLRDVERKMVNNPSMSCILWLYRCLVFCIRPFFNDDEYCSLRSSAEDDIAGDEADEAGCAHT